MITEKYGRYTIIETLGTGSMGVVYRAEDPSSGRPVAVKVIRARVLYSQDRRERFLQNMLAVSLVSDPHICPILEIGDESDDFFVVTPLLGGKPLSSLIREKSLSWREALSIVLEALRGLQSLHEAGIAHRGVKPSNIWVDSGRPVMLTDSALARFTEFERRPRRHCLSSRTEFADTLIPLTALAYMSPEQVRGEQVDRRTDLFSLAVVMHELLAGRHPFEARNSLSKMSAILEAEPARLVSAAGILPEGLEAVVRKALSKDPNRRQTSAEEFERDILAVMESDAMSLAPAMPAAARASVKAGWPRWIAFGLGTAAVAGLAVYTALRLL